MKTLLTILFFTVAASGSASANGNAIASRAAPAGSVTPIETAEDDPRILALGDSMMAWHLVSRSSISDAMERALGEEVENRAVGGARILYALPITGAMGLNITKQYRNDAVDWVVINGGGNDLMLGCGCNKCDRKMSRMISPNGQLGVIPDLVGKIRSHGARVIYVGYLRSPGVDSAIDSCRPLGDAFEARISNMVRAMDGVYFLDVSDLVPNGDRSFHGMDMIHPSKKGSQVIGQKLAAMIRKLDKTR